MEPAVTTVLAGVSGQLRPWDDLGDLRSMQGFQASRKPVLWLQAVPTAGGIAGSRRHDGTGVLNGKAAAKDYVNDTKTATGIPVNLGMSVAVYLSRIKPAVFPSSWPIARASNRR